MKSESPTVSVNLGWVAGLPFWTFVIIKIAGTSMAAWSWWWMFIPFVPLIGEVVRRYGL